MSYNTYWEGNFSIDPALSEEELKTVGAWLGRDNSEINLGIITDDEVIERLVMNDWHYTTPYDPLGSIDKELIYIESESHHVEIMAIILDCFFKLMRSMGKTIADFDAYWNGDDSGDLGKLEMDEEGQLWVCPATIVYASPEDTDSQVVS